MLNNTIAETESIKEKLLSDHQSFNGVIKKPPTIASLLGDIVWLLMQSPTHKFNFMIDLEWMVIPPLMLNQFRIFRGDNKPVGVAFWAYLKPESVERINLGVGKLRPDEWADPKAYLHNRNEMMKLILINSESERELWLVDLIAPFGHGEKMLDDLCSTVMAHKTFRFHKMILRQVKEISQF